ncbi:MAG: hypothetical protein WCO53_11560 [Deltaproteobacteria bacterium]
MTKLFVQKILDRLFYYQKVFVFVWEAGKCNSSFQAKIPISFGHASPEELSEVYLNKETDLKSYPWEFLEEKIVTGRWHCICAKHKEEIIGYALYSTAEMSFAGTKSIVFDLPTNAAYIFKAFVYPTFRNLSIHKAIADFTFKTVHEMGFDLALFSINSTNNISIHNNVKLGSAIAGSAVFIKTRFFNKVFISGRLDKMGVRIRKIF